VQTQICLIAQNRLQKRKAQHLENEIRQWLDDFGAGRWKLPPKDKKKEEGAQLPYAQLP
jgi:hypothetical protein